MINLSKGLCLAVTSGPEAVPCQHILLLSQLGYCLGNDICLDWSIEGILSVMLVNFDGQDFKM